MAIDIADRFYVNKYRNCYGLIDVINNVNIYGRVLYFYYVIQFLIADLVLLLALISGLHLTNSHENQTKQQPAFK